MVNDCLGSVGGTKELYFIEHENVTAVTEAQGVVTTIAVAAGKQFRKYELPKETASWTETLQSNQQNGTQFYQQVVSFVLNKMEANKRNELMLLAQNTVMCIVRDMNGKYFLVGKENGLNATGGDGGTGTAAGDRNGYTRELTAQEPQMAPEVSAAIISGLIAPAA